MKIKYQYQSKRLLALSGLIAGVLAAVPALAEINIDQIVHRTEELIKIKTYRGDDNPDVLENLEKIRQDYFQKWVDDFNKHNKHQLEPFDWQSKDQKYRVFGWRAGTGKRKISIISHLDTVGPGNNDWQPFKPRREIRLYKGSPTEFLVGRGSIDDKGPAVTAFEVLTETLKSLQNHSLDNVTLELMLDTSEETNMSTPKYYKANPEAKPVLGIVFDAFWCVRAEKGTDRPKFTVVPDAVPAPPDGALHITRLVSAKGPVNMIPTNAEATIVGDGVALKSFVEFVENVEKWYLAYQFDDIDYRPAELVVIANNDSVVLRTLVAGAQHGSAPQENRANGANPTVSLTNFLASLVDNGTLANSPAGELSRFIRWAFGTYTMGETHPDLLARFDTIFREGNGTTYGLTALKTETDGSVSLEIDVRYAIGHHSQGWDGSEGQLKMDCLKDCVENDCLEKKCLDKDCLKRGSLFLPIFKQLVENYQNNAAGAKVTLSFSKETATAPDISDPRGTNLSKVNAAYRAAMGTNCPMYAVGGSTDAKGHPELVAAGALFTDNLGPPINFHGLDEGAPLIDLQNSAKILMHLFKQEVLSSEQ